MKDNCIIYLLTNTANNKIYIGQTWNDLKLRMGVDGKNYKNSVYLYSAIQKYGVENFKYTILKTVSSQEEANFYENKYIKDYNSLDSNIGYNIKEGGANGKHSEETKYKISESIKNKEWSQEALKAKSDGGKKTLGIKRKPLSEERKNTISSFSKEWHENNEHPMLNKKHTEEARQKISDALKGRIVSEETKAKRAATLLLKNNSEERDKKIIDLYLSGTSHKEIKEILNIGTGTIYRVLEKNGIKRDPYREGTTHHWAGKSHSEETKLKMSKAKLENNSSKK